MSDPTWENRSGPRSGRPPEGDDDWRWDDIDWFEEPEPESSSVAAGAERRTGLIPAAGGSGGQPPEPSARSAAIRRRRIFALTALGLLFILALVIPLVVFGGDGGGGGVAEQTTPLTTAERASTAARTTTQERPPTTTSAATTLEKTTLRVALPQGEALSRGDRGTAVTNLQKGLAALGFATGEPDGVFGATTEAAVVDFQQSNNLTPDGIVGSDTVRLLNAALAEKGVTE
jgi:hypothetical protein